MALRSSGSGIARRVSTRTGQLFAAVPIRPNTWTVLSLFPALVGLYALVQDLLLVALGLFVAAGFVDVIDGAVARERDETSAFGAYLDGMIDRFVEAAFLVGLMLFGYPDWVIPGWLWLALLLFFGTALTSFARAYADHRGVVTDPERLESMGGLLERAERMLLIFVSMALWFVDPILATYTIALATLLAVVTVLQRMAFARKMAT